MQTEHRYDYLYPDNAKKILCESPICYVTLGSMEWHDLHLPLGTDSFIAHGLCLRMAKETEGVVLPPHHWSIYAENMDGGPYVCEKAHGRLCTNNAELSILEDGNRQIRDIVDTVARDIHDACVRNGINVVDCCPHLVKKTSDIRWSAKWIAPPGKKHENYYFLARKNFEAPGSLKQAVLRVAADSRYAIYVNGRFVGNGPVRGTHRRYFFDSYEITRLMTPGENWITAEVHCPVRATYTAAPHVPGLLAEIEGIVSTNSSWETLRCPSRRHDAPLYTMQIGFSEWRDMRAERKGWQTGKDDREAWQPAEEVGNPQDFGGRVTNARSILPLTHDVFFPLRTVECGHVPNAKSHIEDPEYALLMSTESHLPADPANITDMDALTRHGGVTTVIPAPNGTAGAFLILDFDREVFGNLEFDIEAPDGTVMDVGHGDVQRQL